MATELENLPAIEPTAEEKIAYERQFGPAPLNPLRDLSAPEIADLAAADSENFEIVSAFRQQKNLWKDPAIVQKVADAHNLIKQRGFSLADLPSPKKAVGMAVDVAKGFLKQGYNYGAAAVETAMGIGADITGREGIARELEQQAQRRIAENIAGSEQALFGLAEMGERAIQKGARAVGIAKPLEAKTPQEKISDLWKAVGSGETQEDIARGQGGFLQPVGGEVISELAAAGKPVRPEETSALAAGDPFSFYAFGKGFQLASGAVPTVARTAAAQVGQRVAAGAEKAAGVATQAAGKLTELGGQALQVAGKSAPIASAVGAAVSGAPISALAIMGGGTAAGRTAQVVGKGVQRAGQTIQEVGRQVSGKPIVSATAQGIKDVAGALPGAVGEIVSGTAADLGLAAVSSETPQQTEGAVGIGTVLGGVGAAKRVAGRVLSGQLIAPREYGIDTPVTSSGNFPSLDAMHSAAYSAAPPGVRARLNAVRQFASGANVNTDVFLAPDGPTLERVLIDSGVDANTAKQFSQQEGFFTTSLPDRAGNPRRVIVARNVEATPHESFHAFQDVLGESANRELDTLIRQEYGNRWDAEGNRYAQRLVGDLGNRAWEEVILDESGWGLDAAKEKIYSDIYNRLEAETGAAPTEAQVRDLADPELVRVFNEAQSRNPNANPNQFWREILSPAEAKAEADRYIARELAAENFDAVFKQQGAGLTPGTSIPQRLARVVGNFVSALGGEPLAGRRTEIGQIEPRFAVTERVSELARGKQQPVVQPRAATPPATPAAPKGRIPVTPEGRQQVADEARTLAESAPEEPIPGGTRSPRELLGQIAEAIAQQAGVRINYLSAPGEPAAATTSNRTARREIIEAFRTMPQAARSLWEKSFFPERVIKTKSGYQVMGWAPEVFAANAHKLARALSEIPGGENLTPYQLDAANKTFSEAGWRQLFDDTQTFVRNQMAGQTGAGEPLVVPAGVTERGFFAPPSTPARASALAQPNADVVNMLFNFKLPESPRITSGKLPLNIAGQEISIATARGPQRLSVPVEPKPQFAGKQAAELGIEGRSILEVNPARAAIESAAKQAGVELPSFIEAIQKLNLENIKEVELAPELPQFRGNTLTLTAGFQPSANPRAVKAAAVRDEQTGRIFEGSWHGDARDKAVDALGLDLVTRNEALAESRFEDGFTTNTGEFLNRERAFQRAEELNQISSEDAQKLAKLSREHTSHPGFGIDRPQLESLDFDAVRQFQPVAETARRLIEMPPEEWLNTVRNYKGKLGAGLTGWAWDLGAQAKSMEDVQALRHTTEVLREASKSGDLDQRLELIGRAQAAREAYEAATGRNLENTNDGSAVPGIRKMVDPNYNPPVPLGTPATRESMVAKFQAQPTAAKVSADEGIRELATKYAKSAGVEYAPTGETIPVNESLAKRLADIYEAAQHAPSDPNVAQSYTALGGETLAQYRAIADAGYNIEPWTGAGEPYKSSAEMVADVRNNKHLYFLPTEGAFDDAGGNLMLRDSGISIGDRKLSVNDVFRAVHDFFGHAKEGHQFGPRGELNAWVSHSEMFSPAAQGALAAETLAQNSWVNYGAHLRNSEGSIPSRGEPGYLGPTERPFAEQKNIIIPDELIQEARGRAQFQPEGEPEWTLRTPKGGGFFSKAWILPTGEPVQLGSKWHHEWLNENADTYGISTGVTADADSRVQALQKGFARLNYARNGGQLTVEARAADWPKLRPAIQQFVETNLDRIDNLRVELFNDDVSAVADSESVKFHTMNSDTERLSSIPFMETAPAGGVAGGQVTGISQARARQFQPAAEEQPEFAGFPESTKKAFLTTSQLGNMSRAELQEHFPEAIVPRKRDEEIPSDIRNAPLIKNVDNPEQVYSDALVEFAREKENTPEYQMGRKWYSEFSEQLKSRFGTDARIFAELLAATSPQTSVESNFKFALDALEGFKSGRFKKHIAKFEQALKMIADEKWLSWYNRELNAGRIKNPPAKPTPAAFMARWIESHDIKPRQSNGKLFGINSIPVLQVAARRWLEQNKGPKVKNFVENLLGEGTEATIDLWADRTLRRLGYEGFAERWRIMPVNKRGVSDEDFAFAQSIFRNAAEQLGLKPSELQAAVWFAEKQLWNDNGWSRLDLGDFREELKKTDRLRAEIQARETPEKELISVEPRGRIQSVKSQSQPVKWEQVKWPYNSEAPYNTWEVWQAKLKRSRAPSRMVLIYPGISPDKGLSFVVKGEYSGFLPGITDIDTAKAELERRSDAGEIQ
jgi:hypothetical protein